MKVSIAMATYNGESYLFEQLESIYKQTRKPDEVVICDDCSTDNTLNIIYNFIKTNKLEDKWRVIKNEKNKGYIKNFIDCALKTTGDIVFFCDQDDIWCKDKIYRMIEIYENDKNVQALTCTYKLINEKSEIIRNKFNQIEKLKGKGKLRKISFEEQINRNSSCGMVLSIKRDIFDKIVPIIIENNMTFDLPIGVMTSIHGGFYNLGEDLAYRRMHSQNTSAPKDTFRKRFNNIDYHIMGREGRINDMIIYDKVLEKELNKKQKINLQKAIKSSQKSLNSIRNRDISNLILDLFSLNPMINKYISIMNLLCALFGDYSKVRKDNI